MKRINHSKINRMILWVLISILLVPIVMIIDLLVQSSFEKNIVYFAITLAIAIAISLVGLISKLYKSR